MSSPLTEAVVLALIIAATLMVLGVGWLVYLAKGGKPFSISVRGLGLSVEIGHNSQRIKCPIEKSTTT